MLKSVGSIVVGLVLAGIFIGFRVHKKAEADSNIKGQALEVLQQADGFDQDREYYLSLLDHAHPGAFSSAYSMGGRRRAASFNADRYLDGLFRKMHEKASQDGRSDVAGALGRLQQSMRAPAPRRP